MKQMRRVHLLALLLATVAGSTFVLAADPADGIDLSVSPGPGAGEFTLDWAGGQPDFEVFRSTDASTVTDPGNKLGDTSTHQWIDTPPAGAIFFYRTTNLVCALGIECDSANCADTVCCDTPCTAICEACNLFGFGGTCLPIPAGQDPDAECPSATTCNGAGSCTGQNGEPCATSPECASGNCVDEVCCSSSCGGLCEACNLPGNEGTCDYVPAFTDPDGECAGDEVCDGAGSCSGGNGSPCGSPSECVSGNCIDDLCCDTACTATCEACNLPGSEGTCDYVPAGTDPDSECAGPLVCDGAGSCSGGNGAPCGSPSECLSGNCVDGYCCDTSCSGLCEACNLSGGEGSCRPVPAGSDPDGECSGALVCDGLGGCALGNGQVCTSSPECASAQCVDDVCCDSSCSGLCEACDLPGSEGSCSLIPYGSDPEDECPGALVCDGTGSCSGDNGDPCSSGPECSSGYCVDNVCCDGSCGGLCEACNLSGSEGSCSPVLAGQDPGGECAGDEVCDGAGGCALANGSACGSGAECISTWCVDNVCCDGSCGGLCEACNVPGNEGTCEYVPVGTDPDSECTGAQVCDGFGGCALPNGSACGSGAECISTWCVDNVCCDGSCTGPCEACNLSGSEGSCRLIPYGSDPDDECPGALVCDGTGSCSGQNGDPCSLGTECLSGWCVDNLCCDASCAGLCEACNLSGSEGSCSLVPAGLDPDSECAGDLVCDGSGGCSLANGSACSSGAECISTWCVDNVCCDASCGGLCEACDLPGNEGTCDYVPAFTDPDSECAGDLVCDGTGSCSGGDGAPCGSPGECASGNCVDGYCCDSACVSTCEACNLSGSVGTCDFVPYGADPDSECPGASTCNGIGACAYPDGFSCISPSECLSGNCVDGYCCDSSCSGLCQACNLPFNEGRCEYIPAGEDPDNECFLASTCDGAGGCN
jgi:hypothetical protein